MYEIIFGQRFRIIQAVRITVSIFEYLVAGKGLRWVFPKIKNFGKLFYFITFLDKYNRQSKNRDLCNIVSLKNLDLCNLQLDIFLDLRYTI